MLIDSDRSGSWRFKRFKRMATKYPLFPLYFAPMPMPTPMRLVRYLLSVLFVTSALSTSVAAENALTRFSDLPAGGLAPGSMWVHQPVGKIAPNTASIQSSGSGKSYLQIHSKGSASAWSHAVPVPINGATKLTWQWFVRGAPGRSQLNDKASDDFAARLYVVFDYPLSKVPFGQRLGIRIARAIYGDLPAAALCYVWLPGGKAGELAPSPYTGRVKMLVANSQASGSGWQRQQRDLLTDFQRAFGEEFGPGMPPIKAIVVSADTDQSGGQVDAAFADVVLGN